MIRIITIPKINEQVEWFDHNTTCIYGTNGTGKTLLMKGMMQWCEEHGYDYAFYTPFDAEGQMEEIFSTAGDEVIYLAAKQIGTWVINFDETVKAWWKMEHDGKDPEGDEHYRDIPLLKESIRMSGAGYTKMFVMGAKGLLNQFNNYYFLDTPEQSIHPLIVEHILNWIQNLFPYMKIIVATHSDHMIEQTHQYEQLIRLPADFLSQKNARG